MLFSGEKEDCARANLILRCGERVLWRLGSFEARSFEELFQGVRALPWEDILGKEDAFPVKGFSIGSQLHSVPDCQRIVKKAVVERLRSVYHQDWLEETGPKKQIQFSLMSDRCEILLDTTGAPLYKRGYKLEQNDATLREMAEKKPMSIDELLNISGVGEKKAARYGNAFLRVIEDAVGSRE